MRGVIPFAVLALASLAGGQKPAHATICPAGKPCPSTYAIDGGPMFAAAYGVKADGATSDDAALKLALDDCGTRGAEIILPPGRITLTGAGAAPITLQNCHISGAGVPAGTFGAAPSYGTTVLLTSTTVKPFIAGNNWSMSGINFYWPNQTDGVTVYPPLLSCDVNCIHWSFRDNVVVNAYDFFADALNAGIGSFFIVHNWMYAVHDLIRSAGQGDSFHFSENQLTSGNWNRLTNNTNKAALNAASLVNTVFHLTNNTGFAWNLNGAGNVHFNWRYGFKLDATALIGLSTYSATWDAVQTIVDTSSGGTWAFGNTLKGVGGCGGIDVVTGLTRGNAPCFNLGPNGAIDLEHHSGANGTFIKTTGTSVRLFNSGLSQTGTIGDGGSYYAVDIAGNSGGLVVEVGNTLLQGHPATATLHGIGSSNASTASRLTVTNVEFDFFQDPINVIAAPTTKIDGNWSVGTNGSVAIALTGTSPVQYGLNTWDKPPLATMGACGTSPASHGGMSGFFTTGTGGTTSCVVTLPWVPLGLGGGACTAMTVNATTVSGSPSGSPPTWTFGFSAAYNGGNVFYNCPGQQ